MDKKELLKLIGDNKVLSQLIERVYNYGYKDITIDTIDAIWDFEFSYDMGTNLGIYAEECGDFDESYSDFFNYNFVYFEKNFDDFIMKYGQSELKLSDGRLVFITNKWAEEGMEEWVDYVTISLVNLNKLNCGLISNCYGYLQLD